MENENQEDIRTLKELVRRLIIGLLPVLAMQEIGDVSQLPLDLFDVKNTPVVFHNFVSFIQKVGSWLRENTRNEQVKAELMSLYEDLRQTIGDDEFPECLFLPEVCDYYRGVLLSDESLPILFEQCGDLTDFIREEKGRILDLEKSARRSGYWLKAQRIKDRYFRLNLIRYC